MDINIGCITITQEIAWMLQASARQTLQKEQELSANEYGAGHCAYS